MEKIKLFYQKNSKTIVIVIIAISSTIYIRSLYSQARNKILTQPTPTPFVKVADFKSIIPGTSSEKDLEKVFGLPLESTNSGIQKINNYRSTSESRLHTVVITSGKVELVKEIVSSYDKVNSDSITATYGTAPNILYNDLAHSNFSLHVYPSNGIAYLGHIDGTLLEIWYFPPTDIESFIRDWGQGYTGTPPSNEYY